MSSESVESIPVIDIGPYLDGTDKIGVATQIDEACRSIGFFMISNHGIDKSLMRQLKEAADLFFDMPLPEKEAHKAPFGLGYMADGTENVATTHDESKLAVKDHKESLNLTLPIRDGEKLWPNDADLRRLGKEYYEKIEHLSTSLMRLFALALKLDEHYFDDKVNHPYTTLRLLNYPEQRTNSSDTTGDRNKRKTRNAEHTDYGTLTLLWSPDSRGLQAKTRAGEWIDVVCPINSDKIIVNIGDLMMNWTNDEWVSTLHRVLPHPDTGGCRRFSMPFFHNPNPDTVIECLATCHSESNPPKYPPIVAKEHLERKVSKALGTTLKMSDYPKEDKEQNAH